MVSLRENPPRVRTSLQGGTTVESLSATPRTSFTGGRPGAETPSVAASGLGLFGAPLTGVEREQAEAYFTDLLSYSLERLSKEPQLLKADEAQLERQSQETAVGHYRAFIEVAGGLSSMRDEMGHVVTHLDALLEGLPVLNAACTSFTEGASSYASQRADIRQLHRQHPLLLELLEVPQLMDTCVRNGNYDDALDLRAFISKMAVMHPQLQVINLLVKEVEGTSEGMREALLARLRAPIQLPECLRVVGHLRRLAVFSEAELRLHFLKCREEWLAEVVEELEFGATYDYIKRLTDVHRLHLFDVIMQYRAIFSDDLGPSDASGVSPTSTVYSWAQHRITFYLDALREALPRVMEGGSLASVLEHCMYCGMSLGRVGLDFRGLLCPIFEACVRTTFAANVKAAVDTFLLVLEVHKWVALPSLASRSRRSGGGAAEETAASEEGGPPYALMEQPPLAILVNGLLAALNELRHCAPLAVAQALASTLQDGLGAAVKAMAHLKATRLLPDEEAQLLEAACDALIFTLVPYITSCFTKVYPGVHIDTTQVVAALAPATPRVASKPSASLPFDLSSQRLEATSSGKLAGSSSTGPLPATTPVGDTKDVAPGEPGTGSTASTDAAGVVPPKEQSASTAAPATDPAAKVPARSEAVTAVGGAGGGDGA